MPNYQVVRKPSGDRESYPAVGVTRMFIEPTDEQLRQKHRDQLNANRLDQQKKPNGK